MRFIGHLQHWLRELLTATRCFGPSGKLPPIRVIPLSTGVQATVERRYSRSPLGCYSAGFTLLCLTSAPVFDAQPICPFPPPPPFSVGCPGLGIYHAGAFGPWPVFLCLPLMHLFSAVHHSSRSPGSPPLFLLSSISASTLLCFCPHRARHALAVSPFVMALGPS